MEQPDPLIKPIRAQTAGVEGGAPGVLQPIPHFQYELEPPVRDVQRRFHDSFSPLERLALFITVQVGSFGFFLIVFGWTVIWLTWNMIGPPNLRFDPGPAFVLWLFISNVIQICLMPLIMVGQNAQGRHAEMRAENDYQVNLKAEREIEVFLLHLEYQNTILLALVEKVGPRLEEMEQHAAPPATGEGKA